MQRLNGNILVHSVVRVVLGPPRDVVAIWEITHWLACESLVLLRSINSVGIIVVGTNSGLTAIIGTQAVVQGPDGVTGSPVVPVPASSKHVSTHSPGRARHVVVSPYDRCFSTKTLSAHHRHQDNDCSSAQCVDHDDVSA